MHSDTAANWLDDANHHMNLESAEVLRLRKLMQESILKVEKENLEIIQKELNNKKENNKKFIHSSNDSKKIPKHQNRPSSSYSQIKSAKGVRQQKSNLGKIHVASNVNSSNANPDTECKNAQPKCQYSSIHFLNHFQSSFPSSRTHRTFLHYDSKDKYTACAVPLAPPCQKKEAMDFEQNLSHPKSLSCVSKNVVHHVVSEVIPKKLTVQALPSISIIDRKPKNQENIRLEEIREKNYSSGDGIKTTILPVMSDQDRNRISSINLSSTQINEISASEQKNDQLPTQRRQRSIFTQISGNERSLQIQPQKGLLKEIIKEVFKEFQTESADEFFKIPTNKNFNAHEPRTTSTKNDCELDSFIGNTGSLANDVTTMVSPNVFMQSSYTQTTSCDLPQPTSNETSMRNLVHEVVLEMQQNPYLKSMQNMEQPKNAHQIEKVHRDIQVDFKRAEINQDIISHTSHAVQTSLVTENETLVAGSTNKTSDENDNFADDDFQEISTPAVMKNNEAPEYPRENAETAATSDIPSKLESVLNFIYDRFCKETGELSLNAEKNISNYISPKKTREVSIQFNPVSTSTKSTETSNIISIDVANQCDDLLPQQTEIKDIRNASVQVVPELEMVPEKVDSSVQWDQPASALKDSCVQTVEFLNPSENSANSSVSSTPFSDSIFLDDMLSEGEILLPWNLRLLSHTDKGTIQSSNNTTEGSDKEKDYSLSEGEVPPKYLQQFSVAQSPSYDSSSDAYTDPHNLPTPTPQSHCTIISNSSLSEGEIKNSNTSLSEGEVPYSFLQNRLAFQQGSSSLPFPNEHGSEILHRNFLDSRYLGESSHLQENFRHTILDVSEGEVIGRPATPYQSTPFTSFLDTVNEEK